MICKLFRRQEESLKDANADIYRVLAKSALRELEQLIDEHKRISDQQQKLIRSNEKLNAENQQLKNSLREILEYFGWPRPQSSHFPKFKELLDQALATLERKD